MALRIMFADMCMFVHHGRGTDVVLPADLNHRALLTIHGPFTADTGLEVSGDQVSLDGWTVELDAPGPAAGGTGKPSKRRVPDMREIFGSGATLVEPVRQIIGTPATTLPPDVISRLRLFGGTLEEQTTAKPVYDTVDWTFGATSIQRNITDRVVYQLPEVQSVSVVLKKEDQVKRINLRESDGGFSLTVSNQDDPPCDPPGEGHYVLTDFRAFYRLVKDGGSARRRDDMLPHAYIAADPQAPPAAARTAARRAPCEPVCGTFQADV